MMLLLALLSLNLPARAEYVKISGREVYADYQPAAKGGATLVLLNGLTYSTTDWDQYVKALHDLDPKLGVLRFDLTGMGKTLLKGPLPVNYEIPIEGQVELTEAMMAHYGLPKSFIVGLSYGGGLAVAFAAAHPERVEQIVLMAPFTEPLKNMDTFIRGEVAANRLAFPFNPATDDELYDFFLRQFIYSTYPSLEPSVLDNPYKLEGIFRMVQGIRKYDTFADAKKLAADSVHLLVAENDQYIAKEVHDRFWRTVPESARASRVDLSNSEHKIPQAVPGFAAAWTMEIVNRRPELNRGLSFQGDTPNFTARSGSTEINLPRP